MLFEKQYPLVSRVILGFVIASSLKILPASFDSVGVLVISLVCFAGGFVVARAMDCAQEKEKYYLGEIVMHLIGFYDYTVILTYLSLVSSLCGMVCIYKEHFWLAVGCLAISGTCDMFDGIVARSKKNRTEDEKNFGIQLDSLCDVVCFGVFPAVLLYFSGVNTVFGVALLIFYVLCALIRLAFFSVLETKRQKTEGGCAKEYRGLPVTSSDIIFPFFYLVGLLLPGESMSLVYSIVALLTAILFVSDFPIPKLDVAKLLGKVTAKQNGEGTAEPSEEAECAASSGKRA